MTTIYELPPRSAPYTITVGGGPLNEWLGGWQANSVIVDNHSTQHVLVDAGIYCPPLTVGKVVPIPSENRVRANFAVPPGLNDGPPIAGQVAQLTYFQDALEPHPGVPDGQINAVSPPQIIDTVQLAANANATHNGVVVPVGAHSLLAVSVEPAGGQPAGSVSIVGAVTQLHYVGTNGGQFTSTPSGLVFFPVVPPDTSINVTWTAGSVATNFWLIALSDPEAVDILGQVASVLTQGPSNVPLYTVIEVAALPLLGVTLSGANPAPWQAPRAFKEIEVTNGVFPANVVSAVAGQTIYVFGWQVGHDATAAARYSVLDNNPNRLPAWFFGQNGSVAGNLSGVPLGVGNPLRLNSTALNGETARAAVSFTQI